MQPYPSADRAAQQHPGGPDTVLTKQYIASRTSRLVILAGSMVLLLIAAFSVTVRGIHETGIVDLARLVLSRLSFGQLPSGLDAQTELVLLNLRLPRVVMAMIAGAALSVAGVLMQAITRNPLVSPYTIGVSSAAAFGASVAIMFGVGFTGAGYYFIPLTAFAFALGAATLVFSVSWWRNMGPQALILTGIALMYLFSAMTAAIQFIANEQQLARVVHWTFGSLNGVRWQAVAICGLVLVIVLPVMQAQSWKLNVLTVAGDDVARSLGIEVTRLRAMAIVLAVFSAASVISFLGVIGFVGLIGPHVARMLIGGDHRYLLPFSAITGAGLLLATDTIGRLAFAPIVVPVGIVVAFVGVPLFLHLILSRQRTTYA